MCLELLSYEEVSAVRQTPSQGLDALCDFNTALNGDLVDFNVRVLCFNCPSQLVDCLLLQTDPRLANVFNDQFPAPIDGPEERVNLVDEDCDLAAHGDLSPALDLAQPAWHLL